ncbi:flagellar motor switch protein FliM [Acetobacter oeni]|uniref:Flagellar motor switch protein FliM n=1 Tax=Acetobacter oeni TaxID=304077 RepID=A0A511XGX7_9PROT|nr:flagellar motor switch protein FliM [Acetobacter oeni]MBB3882340.1 flagellar motor switch protein FliM [Acetobacter oeni]NHO18555.1 flagellar motor switch protein FliM [Acetobacter oeni]GBR02271.1 flagellar motor switch protein FliM [Acetobacter oeni LMG 21952]GEN62203.1 flagellar motor switch protein FliM [Acetobacter oeni]
MSGTQGSLNGNIPRPGPTASLRDLEGVDQGPAYADGVPPDDDAEHVLDQAEIDSILGNAFGGGDIEESTSGLERIIGSGLVSYERLPMLEVVFDRLMRIVSTTLRNFTNDNVDVSIDGISSMRFGDYLNSAPASCIFAVFKAEEWENYGLMVVDSALTYSMVDVLLGGARNPRPLNVEGRLHTTIERSLIEKMVKLVLEDLSVGFDPICAVNFKFERLEISSRFAAICRASNAVFLARMRVEMDDRGGNIDVLLPYSTLEPVRDLLLQQFMGEKFGRDSIWETHLAEKLRDTDVQLEAVLGEQTMKLSEIVDLKPGSVIVLEHQLKQPVSLRCGQIPMFTGKLGRKKENIAIRIEEDLLAVRQLLDAPEGLYS